MANSSFQAQLNVLNKKIKLEDNGEISYMKKSFCLRAYQL